MQIELKFVPKVIAERIKKLFKSLAKEYVELIYKQETLLYAFGVFTDSDMSNYYFGYNTEEGMNRIIQDGIKHNEEYPDSKLKTDSSKWWLPEWTNKVDDAVFQTDSREIELFKIFEKLKSTIKFPEGIFEHKDFSNYKEDIFDLLCQSLEELRINGLFSKVNSDFYILVQESDNGIYGTRHQSLSKILTQEQLEEYLKFNDDYLE